MTLLRALQQLHDAGSPIGPAELSSLRTIVDSAIKHDLSMQAVGARDARENLRAGERLYYWIQLRDWLESFE